MSGLAWGRWRLGRSALPLAMIELEEGQSRLSRSFGRPKLMAGEEVLLELESVGGVTRAELNGMELPDAEPGRLLYLIAPGVLRDRNLLILEVDWDEAGAVGGEFGWGEVALLIRTPGETGTDWRVRLVAGPLSLGRLGTGRVVTWR